MTADTDSLADWLAVHAGGRSYLQLGGLGLPQIEHTQQALAAGASRVVQLERTPPAAADWASLRARCAPHDARLTTMAQNPLDAHGLARRLPRFDIVHIVQLFHERDPYLLLERLSRHAKGSLVVSSSRIPSDPDGLAPGEMVAGFTPHDPRLAAVRDTLDRRGVNLHQFHRPADHVDAAGVATWEGMWNWFQTDAALRALLRHFGWEVTHAFPSWGDLGITLVTARP